MNDTIKIGLPMEYEDDKNIIRTGMWLKEYEVEALEKRLNKCNQLQSNWNSLRQWVQKHYDEYKDMEQDAMFEFGLMLDKMNELEGKDNN